MKDLLTFSKIRFISILIGVVVALILGTLSYSPWTSTRYNRIESLAFDLKQNLQTSLPESPYLVHIDVDDNSIDVLGRWPWNRSVHGKMVETLAELGARFTVFDIEFYRKQAPNIDQKKFNEEIDILRSADPSYMGRMPFNQDIDNTSTTCCPIQSFSTTKESHDNIKRRS